MSTIFLQPNSILWFMHVKKEKKLEGWKDLVGNNAKDRFVSFQVININAFVTAARHKLTAIMRELQCPQPKNIFTSSICAEVQTLMNILHPTPHQFPNTIRADVVCTSENTEISYRNSERKQPWYDPIKTVAKHKIKCKHLCVPQ